MKDQRLLGTFKNTTGVMIISDPCYDEAARTKGIAMELPCRKGIYEAVVYHIDERNSALMVKHKREYSNNKWEHVSESIFVDSGQCGFFDKAIYGGADFRSACGEKTIFDESAGIVMDQGAVALSGYGDGAYDLSVIKDEDGCIFAFLLDFDVVDFSGEEE